MNKAALELATPSIPRTLTGREFKVLRYVKTHPCINRDNTPKNKKAKGQGGEDGRWGEGTTKSARGEREIQTGRMSSGERGSESAIFHC